MYDEINRQNVENAYDKTASSCIFLTKISDMCHGTMVPTNGGRRTRTHPNRENSKIYTGAIIKIFRKYINKKAIRRSICLGDRV